VLLLSLSIPQTECASFSNHTRISVWVLYRSSSRIIQTRRSSTIWFSTLSRTSSSHDVAQYVWLDMSGDNPSIHSFARYS